MRHRVKLCAILFYATAVSFLALCWVMYLVSFVDGRWAGFCVMLAFLTAFGLAAVLGVDKYAYVDLGPKRMKKPKNWREIKRQKEEEAYIANLEKSLD